MAELVAFIEDNAKQTDFKLSFLSKLYSARLEQLGAYVPERVNSTRLKERLLSQLPDLREYNEGREVTLAFSSDISAALQFKQDYDYDAEAIHLAGAATFVRKEMLTKQQHFNGSFKSDCHHQAVPKSLLALVNMILEGPNIKNENGYIEQVGINVALMLSQLLIFNAVKRHRDPTSENKTTRHSLMRETPLLIYVGLVLHAETRKKKVVDKFYRLGLSISYDRVMQISADLGNSICSQFEGGVVCPSKLKRSLFTTANVDNIDHNPSARTTKDSLHGTAVSPT